MANVYSTQFLTSHAGAPVTVFVPTGFVAVIRTITAFNASVIAPETAALVLVAEDVTIWQSLLTPGPPDVPNSSEVVNMRTVLNPGQAIATNNGSDVDMTVSGYLLSLP